MVSLGNTKLLSIEIGDQCNLAGEHMKCPISIRKHNKPELFTEQYLN